MKYTIFDIIILLNKNIKIRHDSCIFWKHLSKDIICVKDFKLSNWSHAYDNIDCFDIKEFIERYSESFNSKKLISFHTYNESKTLNDNQIRILLRKNKLIKILNK